MESHPPTDVAAPGPEGLAEDVPCPGCQYNLHGLTVPRCPECGFTFTWQDVSAWLEARPSSESESGAGFFVVLGVLALFMILSLAMSGVAVVLLLLPLPVVIAFGISALQAGLEVLIVWPYFSFMSWKRFRSWWEGVLIGYGLCAITCGLLGRPMIFLDRITLSYGLFPAPLLLAITLVESFLVQWWVVGRRARQWNDPIPQKRLVIACAVAKTMLAIPWSLAATGALAQLSQIGPV